MSPPLRSGHGLGLPTSPWLTCSTCTVRLFDIQISEPLPSVPDTLILSTYILRTGPSSFFLFCLYTFTVYYFMVPSGKPPDNRVLVLGHFSTFSSSHCRNKVKKRWLLSSTRLYHISVTWVNLPNIIRPHQIWMIITLVSCSLSKFFLTSVLPS